MSDNDLKELHDIFNDCWRLLKSNADVKQDPAWWDRLVESMTEIYKKHNEHPLSVVMASAIGEYLEKQYKAKYGK